MFTKTTKEGEKKSAVPGQANEMGRVMQTNKNNPTRGNMASIVGGDMVVEGGIKTEGSLQVDGRVIGNIHAGDITIGASGSVDGEVNAEIINVKGRIKGSVRARKVELESGAQVEGDIVHASLQIEPNAVFEGQVKYAKDPLQPNVMGGGDPKLPKPSNVGSVPINIGSTN